MGEFFKQLIAQFSTVWQKLSLQQKIITSALVGFTLLGLISLMLWSKTTVTDNGGYRRLFSNLDTEDAAQITGKLDEGNYKYKLENDGRTILVDGKQIYEVRMALAREGLPAKRGTGYELFDKNNIGITDFAQKLNARRALEGEIQRTIEGLDEVKSVRVHIVIPEPSIFLDQQRKTTASVVVRTQPGRGLNKDQVRGITHLLSSSIEGLKLEDISVLDYEGKLLSSPYGGDETALASSRNMDLQQNVEKALVDKVEKMLEGILGPQKAHVQISADLDFDQVDKTMEQYNPESKVVRSEERSDENVKNAPDGDRQAEKSLTNYEIDKTVQHIVAEVGNVKRLTISVAVDGRYQKGKDGKKAYTARSAEEITNLEDMVKNAVGYDLARGDQISIANVQFDNEFIRNEQESLEQEDLWEKILTVAKYVLVFAVAVMIILLLRSMAKTLAEAMNPPVPRVDLGYEEEDVAVEVPAEIRRSNELLERVEMMTREEPVNVANIIRQWLMEPSSGGGKGHGKK